MQEKINVGEVFNMIWWVSGEVRLGFDEVRRWWYNLLKVTGLASQVEEPVEGAKERLIEENGQAHGRW